MKTFYRSRRFWIIIWIKFCIVQAQDECDQNKSCGNNVSQGLCERRGCCYIPHSPSYTYNCVRKRIIPLNEPPPLPLPPPVEILPPNAVQLSHMLHQNVDRLAKDKELSSPQALQIADSLEDYFRTEVAKTSAESWDYSVDGIFDARIQASPTVFYDPIRFHSGTTIQVHRSKDIILSDITALMFIEYLTMGRVWSDLDEDIRIGKEKGNCGSTLFVRDNSTVISVRAFDGRRQEVSISLQVSVKRINENLEDPNNERFSCTILNEASDIWSSNNCVSLESAEKQMACNCNFTTRGLVRPAVTSTAISFEPELKSFTTIQIVEVIMEGLSFGSLSITLLGLFFIFHRRTKLVTSASARTKERTVVRINFVAALTALHLTSLIGELVPMEDLPCKLTVVLSHYLTLASATWMLTESVTLYFKLRPKRMKRTSAIMGCTKFVISWGIPAVIVITSAAIGISRGTYVKIKKPEILCTKDDLQVQEAFSNVPHCSLDINNHMIWSLTAPLLAIFVINFIVIALIVGFVMWLSFKSNALKISKYKAQGVQHIWHATKGTFLMFPILGIPWLMRYYFIISEYKVNIVFQYVQVILNGLQGVFIFILYCGLNRKTQNTLKKVSTKQKKNKAIDVATITAIPPLRRRSGGKGNQHPYYKALKRPRSASFSTNSTHFRWKTKRSYSFTSTDHFNGGSLPFSGLLRTHSTRSLNADYRPSLIPGLNHESGEPTMISFSFDEDMLKNETLPGIHKSRWHRLPKDFPRFSVIPEEFRRGYGTESLVIENSEAFNSKKKKEATALEEIETHVNEQTVKVDVHINERTPRAFLRNQKTAIVAKKHDLKRELSIKLRREKLKNVTLRIKDTKSYDLTQRSFGWLDM